MPREQGFTTGSEEESNLDGQPLQSQWPGPSLGESQMNDACQCREINSLK